FNKPFALIMTNTWLNDAAPKQLFKEKELQLLMFDKRMQFINSNITEHKITFSSSYYCWNFLPKQLIMESLID
ncbi:MAG: tRNA (adenine-N(6)-)-methyltransferase, partial [Bacteroidetes bacterium]|nr:tRNA (adenine-N(6)-)-methyltransferase [Bacteroidota bacterium]